MAEGRFGFPRLTTLGPFVKSSEIVPFKDIEPGRYSLEDIERIQPQTGKDTRRALSDIINFDLLLEGEEDPDSTTFEYRTEQLSRILEVNEFSSSLLTAMSKAEDKGIQLEATETDRYKVENQGLEEEVVNHMDGKESIFTDDLLSGIDFTWQQLQTGNFSQFESESELRDGIVEKVVGDFNRVMEINDAIRDSREYFPPTTEDVTLDAPVGWGTIDGAHRIVALSQIIGADKEIFIWEWSNEQTFIQQSSEI